MPEFIKKLLTSSLDSQRCPDCDEPLAAESMNIKEGVALCPACGKLSRLSELNTSSLSTSEILDHPPRGCAITSDGHAVTVRVSMFSLLGFIFPAGFAIFWNSITSVFATQALAGLYFNLIGPLPNWFPGMGMKNGVPQMNDAAMGLSETLFMCLFLTPFMLVGIVMPFIAIMNLIGKVIVVIDEMDSYVATGVGFLKWKKRFNPREVNDIELAATAWQSEGNQSKLLEIKGSRTVKFGSLLSEDKLQWIRVVLREILLPRAGVPTHTKVPMLRWLSRN